jgi:hypothetical protein
MQEILTWIIVLGAAILLVIKVSKSLKLFNKPDICSGCDNSCEGCPVAPGNRKVRADKTDKRKI